MTDRNEAPAEEDCKVSWQDSDRKNDEPQGEACKLAASERSQHGSELYRQNPGKTLLGPPELFTDKLKDGQG